jgi:hypothetical protein
LFPHTAPFFCKENSFAKHTVLFAKSWYNRNGKNRFINIVSLALYALHKERKGKTPWEKILPAMKEI